MSAPAPAHSPSHLAVAIAAATTTLAIGVTVAVLGGYVHPPRAVERTRPTPPPTAQPTSVTDPAVVWVPVERLTPADAASGNATEVAPRRDERLAFSDDEDADDGWREHEHGRREEEDDDD